LNPARLPVPPLERVDGKNKQILRIITIIFVE
jgi:hypothetical protein